ncbi:MAG TPA: polysaccharide lyase family protein [Bryobacteraceae bacterium]|nr:polysaccharide lyase family protein [Bryobacteraceae bacterium]
MAVDRTVWQIGKFDDSPVEFGKHPTQKVRFVVGASNAARDWPGRQSSGQPYEVVFPLDNVQRNYRLKITVLIDQPRVPSLRIAVNEHAGTFFLHPKLSYSRSDFSYAFDPHESRSDLVIDIPSVFLRQGVNHLTITPVDDPPTAPEDKELGGFSYDALSLEQADAAAKSQKAMTVNFEPTIFFRKSETGLTEVVDAFVRFGQPAKAGRLLLQAGDQRYTSEYPDTEFGEQRLIFAIPEWKGDLQAQASFGSIEKSQHVTLKAQRQWTIFVVPHTHLDVGYTDYQGKVAETQPRVLTEAENLISQHPDFRFSMDGSWNLEQLLDTRPKPKRDEILELIRDGKMAMPAQYVNLLTGYASLETLYRSLYYSKKVASENHLPFEYANITDVPTYSGSYASVLASSGVKYWVAASNNDRAPVFYYDHWNEKSPFWWEGPDGKKVLFWYSRHYEQVQTLFGLTPQLNAVRESLPIFLQAYSKPSYKPDVALLYGTQVENTDLVPATATFAQHWNQEYAFPKLSYATFPDFFHYLDSHFAGDLPTFKGDGGGYWEDGIGSDAYFEAEDRRNQNAALSAEILSSVTHSINPDLNPPKHAFDDIWRNIILFAEHTWLSYNSVSQPDHDESIKQLRVKDGRAEQASLQIEDVANRSLSQLADQIHIPANTLVVFNSLNWKRDSLVETDFLEGPKLVDLTTNTEVPLEILSNKQGFLHVRFLARDLPAVGYKCFAIHYEHQALPKPIVTSTRVINGRFYRVTIDEKTGSIASIFDKELKRELVNTSSPYKFGEYVYVTGGDGDTQMINPFPALLPGKLTIHQAEAGKLVGVEQMPWGFDIRLASKNVMTPSVETELILFNDEKKIELTYRVHKNYTNAKEGVYIAFPVAAKTPQFDFANQQSWIDPARDLMKGGSLEWFNVQQWMAVSDPGLTVGVVPLDASLATFGDINRGKWPGNFKPESGTMFSYVMNNYWHTNYRAGQDGDFVFHYTVTSSSELDGGALSKLGIDAMRPIELNTVVSQDKDGDPPRPLPPTGSGFLDTSNQDVALITWKEAENGEGSILRFQELGGRATQASVRFIHANLESATLCSGVEDNLRELALRDGALSLSFKPYEVVTVRVRTR